MSKEGLHVVVRNTFLEFSDDTPAMGDEEPRRVRAYSDMTDSKLPVKVELSNSAGFYQVSRHRVSSTMQDGAGQQSGRKGGGRASSGGMDGLTTVMEDQSEYSGDSFGLSGAAFGQGMLPHEQGGAYSGAMGGPPGDLGWMNSLGGPGLSPLPYGTPPPSAWGMGWGGGSGYGGMPPGMPAGFPPGMMPGGMPPYGGYGGQSGSGGFGGHHAQGNMGQGHHDSQQGRNRGGRGKNNIQLSDHLGGGGGEGQRPQKQKNQHQAAPAAAPAPAEVPSTTAPEDLTTVMLRNVPNGYTRGMLLELLNTQGFEGRYDFVYLPMDFRNGVNLGYAFVNLCGNQDAVTLTTKLQGFCEWVSDSTKVCEVSWAHPHQGLAEHVERYRNSPVMHPSMPEDYKPMVFRTGVAIPFPHPTKAIKAPKLRLTVREGGRPGQEEGRSPQTGGGVPGNFVTVCA